MDAGSRGRPESCGFLAPHRQPATAAAQKRLGLGALPSPALPWLKGGQDGRMQWEQARFMFPSSLPGRDYMVCKKDS